MKRVSKHNAFTAGGVQICDKVKLVEGETCPMCKAVMTEKGLVVK